MNMSKQYGDKCCFCINLKTGCYFIAFILLIVQTAGFDMAVKQFVKYITLATKIFIIDPHDPHLLLKFLAYLFFAMVVLAIAITIVTFTVILIIGLYKENRKYIGMYLIFGTTLLLAFVLVCVIESFFNHLDLEDFFERSVCITLSAYFMYIIKCYWISIYPNNEKEHEVKV